MKQIILAVFVLAFSACTNEEASENLLSNEIKTVSFEKRSYEEALSIAQGASKMLDDEQVPATRGVGSARTLNLNDGVHFVVNPRTRAAGTSDQDTLLYVFNYDNDEGFVLVSANANTEGLLAVTELGHYDPFEGTDNPGLQIFLNLAKEYVANPPVKPEARDTLIPIGPKLPELLDGADTVSSVCVQPKLKVQWGQLFPEGMFCVNGVAGCVNTAIAQIMSYYKQPTSIALTYTGDETPTMLTLNWDSLLTHKRSYKTDTALADDNCPEGIHNTLAHLCRQLGFVNQSTYQFGDPNQTGTYSEVAWENLSTIFGYNVIYLGSYTFSSAKSALDNNRLLYMRGRAMESGIDIGGHAWVMDGYHIFKLHHYQYVFSGFDLETGEPIISDFTYGGYSTHNYVHLNWGWRGIDNGYYEATVFDLRKYKTLDRVSSGDSLYFNDIKIATVWY